MRQTDLVTYASIPSARKTLESTTHPSNLAAKKYPRLPLTCHIQSREATLNLPWLVEELTMDTFLIEMATSLGGATCTKSLSEWRVTTPVSTCTKSLSEWRVTTPMSTCTKSLSEWRVTTPMSLEWNMRAKFHILWMILWGKWELPD